MRLGLAVASIAFGLGLCGGYALDEFLQQRTISIATDATASAADRRFANAGQLLNLELGYVYEVVVPRGSDLKVTVVDAAGKMIGGREMKTELDSPPYLMQIP